MPNHSKKMINLTELEQLARAATPGEWVNHFATGEQLATFSVADGTPKLLPASDSDHFYIAAANPSTVLKLIEALRVYGEYHLSISKNGCCDKCQEAKLVSESALAQVAKILGSENE